MATCGFLAGGWAFPAVAAPAADPAVTGTWNVTVKADATKAPLLITGTATFTNTLTKKDFHPATLTLTIKTKTGGTPDAKCKIPDSFTASTESKGNTFATLDANGAFSFPVTVACSGSFTATVTASKPPAAAAAIPDHGDGSTSFDYSPAKAGASALPPRSGALPPANKPQAPGIPALPGSKAAAAGGSGATDPDTFDSSITYPGGSGASGNSDQLANDNAGSARQLNTRLLAACGAGVLLAGVVAAQLVVLNLRGRRLEEASLPVDD